VEGSNKTLIIEVPSDRSVWRIAFQYGKNAWGPFGGSINATFQVNSLEIFDEQHSALEAEKMSASLPMIPGGIDLNPALLDLQIKRDGNGVPLPLPLQPIENMHIDGFLPVIINIVPIANLPLLLGLDLPSQEQKPVQLTYQELSLTVTPARERFYARELDEVLI
jgi:hypothetical protein